MKLCLKWADGSISSCQFKLKVQSAPTFLRCWQSERSWLLGFTSRFCRYPSCGSQSSEETRWFCLMHRVLLSLQSGKICRITVMRPRALWVSSRISVSLISCRNQAKRKYKGWSFWLVFYFVKNDIIVSPQERITIITKIKHAALNKGRQES